MKKTSRKVCPLILNNKGQQENNVFASTVRAICLFCLILFIPVAAQETVDGVVAIVGEEIILQSELMQTTQGYALQAGINPLNQPDMFESLKKEMLENMINEKVLLAKAKEDTVTVEDDRVEAELENRIQQLVAQMGSKEKVESYFGAPIQKIKRDYRDEVRKRLIVQTVQSKKLGDIQISRREIESFYEAMKDSIPGKKPMMKIRHILLEVRPGGSARGQAEEKLHEVQRRLTEGENFEDLARIYSEDPGTSQMGGALGFIERGSLFESFEDAAFRLEPGKVSDIVETPVGLHLIQLVEKREESVNVRHILIRLTVSQNDEAEVLQKITAIRDSALLGVPFDSLANRYSQDASSNTKGGDLGWIPIEELQIQAFKDAIDTLEAGEMSLPFQTPFGFHFAFVEDKTEARKMSLTEDWEEVRYAALNRKQQRILKKWIDDLKKNVYIEIKEDLL